MKTFFIEESEIFDEEQDYRRVRKKRNHSYMEIYWKAENKAFDIVFRNAGDEHIEIIK